MIRWAPIAAAAVLAVIVIARPWSRERLATTVGDGVFELIDGSRVEMRPRSELSFERAEDGVRIRLGKGGIIVNAAKQRYGHLYVQTRDVTVSVVGTVFFVNAEEAGSRVAVIEGEVRVQQGATAKTLLPGEQVTTNPESAVRPLTEAIAWSRNADRLVTLLRQSAVIPPAIAVQGQAQRADVFTETSIRPHLSPASGGRGSLVSVVAGCGGGTPEIDPERFAFTGATLYAVIVWAYGTYDPATQRCPVYSMLNLISGGPAWVRTSQWDIQAVVPAGASGDAPRLRRMVQAMLEDRFRLAIRRESRTVPAYALALGRDVSAYAASLTGTQWLTEKPERDGLETYKGVGQERETRSMALWGRNASVTDLVPLLERLTGRPVIDRTGLTGQFSFSFWYDAYPDADGTSGGIARPLNPATMTSLMGALRDRLGFRLESATSAVEGLVIERAERPSEN